MLGGETGDSTHRLLPVAPAAASPLTTRVQVRQAMLEQALATTKAFGAGFAEQQIFARLTELICNKETKDRDKLGSLMLGMAKVLESAVSRRLILSSGLLEELLAYNADDACPLLPIDTLKFLRESNFVEVVGVEGTSLLETLGRAAASGNWR